MGPSASSPQPSRHVVFVAYDGIQALDLTGPFEVFHGADRVLATRGNDITRYSLTVVAPTASITTESGLVLAATPGAEFDTTAVHTLVVPGGFGAQAAARDDAVLGLVRSIAARAERVVTVCSGSFVAAAAGLLDGKRVTTHWARAAALRREHPSLDVDPEPIYVHDGAVWSSAGVTAGIDLALAIVEHDHDAEVAQVVARWLVMFLRRPGGQTQFAAPVWNERADLEPIRRAQDLIDAAPGDDHRVGRLATRVGMSERHFTRRFTEQVGTSPARYVADVRLEAARRRLEVSDETVATIATRCGFGTDESMRRTFAHRLGVSPDQYRSRFRTTPGRRVDPALTDVPTTIDEETS